MVTQVQSMKVNINGLDIDYLVSGQGDPLIIIHGGGGQGAAAWSQNTEELSKYCRVYVPDLPGLGRCRQMSDAFNLSEFVELLKSFLEKLGLKHVNLLGHSIGGGIVLHYALWFPQEIKSLVLVNSMCLGKEIALWVRLLSSVAFWGCEVALTIMKSIIWLVRRLFISFEFLVPLTPFNIGLGKSIINLKGQTIVLLSHLSALVMPTLLVWGERDPIVPVSHAYIAATLIPQCQLHIFEDCGHSTYRQKLREFSRLVLDFIHK